MSVSLGSLKSELLSVFWGILRGEGHRFLMSFVPGFDLSALSSAFFELHGLALAFPPPPVLGQLYLE